jgi:hypothetical protein
LTATAGALCEAERRRYGRALLLIHEFSADVTRDENHQRNAADLNRFVERLSQGSITSLATGQLHGPISVPGKPLLGGPAEIFVGKVNGNLRTLPAGRGVQDI